MDYVTTKEFKRLILVVWAFIMLIMGAMFNCWVIIKNNLKMPVWTKFYFETDTHIGFVYPHEINYFILSDIIRVGHIYFSVGDLYMFIGVIGIITIVVKKIINKGDKK